MRTVALLDMHHMVRRNHHVMEDLTDPDGNPTGGLFGALASIRTTLLGLRPDHVVLVFDGGTDLWRKALYPGYKDRSEKDPVKEEERRRHGAAVAWQVDELTQKVLPHLALTTLRLPGVEADDVIYAARERVLCLRGLHTIIVSGDKDFLQLVRKDTSIFDPMDKRASNPMEGPPRITRENFRDTAKMANPRQFLDYRALVGDKSDRISGIPGVGDVTARSVLEKFGSLREICANTAKVSAEGKRFALVAEGREIAARNLLLMGLGFRPHDLDETAEIEAKILGPIPPLNQQIVKDYCLEKRALEFLANFKDLLRCVREQQARSTALLTTLKDVNPDLRRAREAAEREWLRDRRTRSA